MKNPSTKPQALGKLQSPTSNQEGAALFATLAVYHERTPQSAAMNMAIDEALLESANVPSLRFYSWESSSLSFGYFGRFADVASHADERDLVRRWTGGGIVFHGEDLTYSIVIPASDTAFGQSSISIYEKVHQALREALVARCERAELATKKTLSAQLGGDRNACFLNPVRADVMLNGRKIAGAAQRRTKRGLLQQGSIRDIDLGKHLAERFAQALSPKCEVRGIGGEVLERARDIAAQKYATDAWLRRR